MKLHNLILASLIIVTATLFAQTPATLSPSMVIEIPVDSPVVAQYLLDVTAIPFTTPEQMEIFFQAHRDDITDFVINKTDRSVYLLLNSTFITTNDLTAEDINRHLAAKALKMREDYLTLPVDEKK
ncbi:MAG: hypothetical protein H7Y00_07320 [Fimbriimonadaceae bacterium]|nr:hypothetical protein [Chitinophagales bacterium]